MRKTLPFILILLLVSCASSSWIQNPHGVYPRDKYVVAVGYGENENEADINAKSELASLFGLRVTSVTARTITETLDNYEDKFSKVSASYIDVDNLYGVEIVKRTVDKNGKHISLAFMEKKPTLEYLIGNIQSERDNIDRLYALIDQNPCTLVSLENATVLIEAVSDYNSHIAIINYLGDRNEEYLDEKASVEKWREVRDSLSIFVNVTGDESGAVRGELLTLLSDTGLRATESKDSRSTLECTINMREVRGSGIASSFVFAEYDAVITLKDNLSDKTILSFSYNGKEGHQNYNSAVTRALKDLCHQIENTFAGELKEKFGNL